MLESQALRYAVEYPAITIAIVCISFPMAYLITIWNGEKLRRSMEKDLEAKFEKGASHNEDLRRELRAEMRDMENKIFERLEKNHNLLVSKLENQINLNSLRNDNIETVLYQIRDALLEKGILSSKISGK